MHSDLANAETRLLTALLHPGEQRLPTDGTRQAARLAIIDAIAVGLGARDHPAARVARSHVDAYLSYGQDVGVWGTGKASSLEGAIWANTVPLRCYDFNDVLHGQGGQGGHPSDVIPGLMAVAESLHLSGRRLIDSVIIAYDVTKILFDSINVTKAGWDYTNLTGLGAVSGFASLLALTDKQGSQALGIFASSHLSTNQLESGDLSASGNLTMWKRFNGPDAVLAALRACQLASSGVEAPSYSLLGDDGFFRRQSGDPFAVVDAVRDAIAQVDHGVDVTEFKRWPVGTRAQSAIEAALSCRSQIAHPSAIDSVRIEVDAAVVKHLVRKEAWRPNSRETADHSLPFAVALALLEGDVSIDHFTTDAFFQSTAVTSLLSKIEVDGRPDPADGSRSSYPTRIIVVSGDETYVGEAEYPPERIRAATFHDELEMKFTALVTRCFSADHTHRIRGTVDALDGIADVKELGDLLSARSS